MSTQTTTPLNLRAETATDVMTPDPVTLPLNATVLEATKTLLDRGISAAPVIDDRGLPVGILSRSDLVSHQCEHLEDGKQVQGRLTPSSDLPDYYQWADVSIDENDQDRGFEIGESITETIDQIMNPIVYFIEAETPIETVIQKLLDWKIHRLFVVNRGTLIGVISSHDILRSIETSSKE